MDIAGHHPHFIYVRTAWPSGCAVLFAVCVSLSCRRPRYVLPACASRSSPFCARTKLLLEELVAKTERVCQKSAWSKRTTLIAGLSRADVRIPVLLFPDREGAEREEHQQRQKSGQAVAHGGDDIRGPEAATTDHVPNRRKDGAEQQDGMGKGRKQQFGLDVVEIHIGHPFLGETKLNGAKDLKNQRGDGEHPKEAHIPVVIHGGVQKSAREKDQNAEQAGGAGQPLGHPRPLWRQVPDVPQADVHVARLHALFVAAGLRDGPVVLFKCAAQCFHSQNLHFFKFPALGRGIVVILC